MYNCIGNYYRDESGSLYQALSLKQYERSVDIAFTFDIDIDVKYVLAHVDAKFAICVFMSPKFTARSLAEMSDYVSHMTITDITDNAETSVEDEWESAYNAVIDELGDLDTEQLQRLAQSIREGGI